MLLWTPTEILRGIYKINQQRDIYRDNDHQTYSAYQSNRSKISTIDNIFIEIFAVINHRIPSLFFEYFHYLKKINSNGDNSSSRLIFADEAFKSLMFLTQISEQNDFISRAYI